MSAHRASLARCHIELVPSHILATTLAIQAWSLLRGLALSSSLDQPPATRPLLQLSERSPVKGAESSVNLSHYDSIPQPPHYATLLLTTLLESLLHTKTLRYTRKFTRGVNNSRKVYAAECIIYCIILICWRLLNLSSKSVMTYVNV